MESEKDRILLLRKLLEYHNYKYYIENSPEISDTEFDRLMHELEKLEALHPELYDPNSPTLRVGQDINQEFTQVFHKYPMLSSPTISFPTHLVRDSYLEVKRLWD